MNDNNGALNGLKVIEMGQLIAGPFCGQLLGDMGADVVKIEPPKVGDPMRNWGQGGAKLWWEVVARNKRSVSIDLRRTEGQNLVRKLIGKADILIENFRPGTLEKWNLEPAALIRDNPKLIVLRVSGYGQTGPYSNRPGFGSIGEAFGGLRHVIGDADRPPARAGISIGDTLAATYGCLGVLAALHHREKTGKGQIVDSAIYEAVLQVMESLVPEYQISEIIRGRSGSILAGVAPSNVYPCKNGDLLIAANQDAMFQRLCNAMGQPKLADELRFKSHIARGENQVELDAIISKWTRCQDVGYVENIMIENAIPVGAIYRAPDMLKDPHYAARKALVEVDHPHWGKFKMQNVAPKMSATPGSVRTLAPEIVGQHTEEVLAAELDLDSEQIAALKERAVI